MIEANVPCTATAECAKHAGGHSCAVLSRLACRLVVSKDTPGPLLTEGFLAGCSGSAGAGTFRPGYSQGTPNQPTDLPTYLREMLHHDRRARRFRARAEEKHDVRVAQHAQHVHLKLNSPAAPRKQASKQTNKETDKQPKKQTNNQRNRQTTGIPTTARFGRYAAAAQRLRLGEVRRRARWSASRRKSAMDVRDWSMYLQRHKFS